MGTLQLKAMCLDSRGRATGVPFRYLKPRGMVAKFYTREMGYGRKAFCRCWLMVTGNGALPTHI